MGISNVFKLFPSLCFSVVVVFFILLVTNFSFLLASSSSTANSSAITPTLVTDNHHGKMVSSPNPPIPLAPPPQQLFKSKTSSFKPSVAVIVGVLTTIFSITFLLLLYAKHCRRVDRSNAFFFNNSVGYPPAAMTTARKNSGIDRAVIESLPIFRFGSLRGQKDGLECAVCLNRFEPTEVLRLLPKCKHAFHVECVDTWLDAHSTCPLCRYRVDPEDVLLVEDNRIMHQNDVSKVPPSMQQSPRELGSVAAARVSGRHSFAGSSLEVIAERGKPDSTTTSSSSFVPRRSLDSWNSKKKRNSENVAVGCFDRPRKDGLLLADKTSSTTSAEQRRLEHRIIVSGVAELGGSDGPNRRWSDVQASDLLFLGSEMILSDSSRFMGSSRGSMPAVSGSGGGIDERNGTTSYIVGGSRNEINARSVSEITGLSRFRSNEQQYEYQQRQQRQAEQRQRHAGAVSRWLAWISQPQTQQQQRQQNNPTLHPPTTSSSPPFSSSSSSLATSTMV